MMKKNQGAHGITKPNDASGSDTITNLRGQRLAAAGKWVASSLILQCPIMTQNPSLTRKGAKGEGLCSHWGLLRSLKSDSFFFFKQLPFRNSAERQRREMQCRQMQRQTGHR